MGSWRLCELVPKERPEVTSLKYIKLHNYGHISNGKRTEWSPIRSVIVPVINKIGRVWLQTELDDMKFSYQLIITLKKLWYTRLFFKSKHKKFQIFFASSEENSHLSARVMARTVHLLRHDAYCPIKAEIRAVDSQSDLTILL